MAWYHSTRFAAVSTHWGRDKMAAIFQTTFSGAFSWLKMYEFRLTFTWNLISSVQLTIFQHWFRFMAWRRPGDKPLSEPGMVTLLTQICVTQPQWVKASNGLYRNQVSFTHDAVWDNIAARHNDTPPECVQHQFYYDSSAISLVAVSLQHCFKCKYHRNMWHAAPHWLSLSPEAWCKHSFNYSSSRNSDLWMPVFSPQTDNNSTHYPRNQADNRQQSALPSNV